MTDCILDIGDDFEDHEDTDDFENPTTFGMYMKAVHMNLLGWVSGSPTNQPTSVPARIAQLGTNSTHAHTHTHTHTFARAHQHTRCTS